jgi:hypothetical protein
MKNGDATHFECGEPLPTVNGQPTKQCGRANVERTARAWCPGKYQGFQAEDICQRRVGRSNGLQPAFSDHANVVSNPTPLAPLAHAGPFGRARAPKCDRTRPPDTASCRPRAFAHPANQRAAAVCHRFPHCHARANAAPLTGNGQQQSRAIPFQLVHVTRASIRCFLTSTKANQKTRLVEPPAIHAMAA